MKNKNLEHDGKSGGGDEEIKPFIPDGPKYKPSKADRKLNKKLNSKKDAKKDYKKLMADAKKRKKKKAGTGNHPLNK